MGEVHTFVQGLPCSLALDLRRKGWIEGLIGQEKSLGLEATKR